MKTPYDRLVKIYTIFSDHMIKMPPRLYIVKNKTLNIFFSVQKEKANGHGNWYAALGMLALPGLHK